MIKYLQLNQFFDVQKLQSEVSRLEKNGWHQHYNKAHYDGQWDILALRSINGLQQNVVAVHAAAHDGGNPYQDTLLLHACPYIRSVLAFFECEKTSVRLMNLQAGATIKEHRDFALNYEEGEVRIHIPVTTHEKVFFWLDNERIPLKEGECWYMNLSLPHRVVNEGPADRIHLVIDCKVNDWLHRFFASQGIVKKEQAATNESVSTKEEKSKIIQELKRLNTAAALQIARQMENEL